MKRKRRYSRRRRRSFGWDDTMKMTKDLVGVAVVTSLLPAIQVA